MTSSVPPALVMLLAGLMLPLVPNRVWRACMTLGAPVVALVLIWTTPDGAALTFMC